MYNFCNNKSGKVSSILEYQLFSKCVLYILHTSLEFMYIYCSCRFCSLTFTVILHIIKCVTSLVWILCGISVQNRLNSITSIIFFIYLFGLFLPYLPFSSCFLTHLHLQWILYIYCNIITSIFCSLKPHLPDFKTTPFSRKRIWRKINFITYSYKITSP